MSSATRLRTVPRSPLTAAATLFIVLCAGARADAAQGSRTTAPPPGNTGTVTATVRFAGTLAPAKPQSRASDPVCAKAGGSDEAVVVNAGLVRDVLVRVRGQGLHSAPPTTPVVVKQEACAYRPRVVGVIRGQTVSIQNGDDTMHNVHAYSDGATEFNLAQPKRAPAIERTIDGDLVVELKCDVHPWMRGYVVPVEHRYFAVTGADGKAMIAGLPAGSYQIEAWHPVLGTRTARVKVEAGKTAAIELSLSR
jgi:plastocyanin